MEEFKSSEKNARHGDLVFTRIETNITGAKTSKELVLAEGEFTGHAHRMTPTQGGSIVFREPEPGVKEFEVLTEPAILTHEEHGPIRFLPGKYRVEFQEEYDYFSEEIRRVTD